MFGALTPSLAATGSQLEAVFKTKSDMSSILSVKRAFDRGDKLPLVRISYPFRPWAL